MPGDTRVSLRWWNEHRTRLDQATDVRVDVFLRSLGAPTGSEGTQARVIERLEELEEQGRIDTYTVSVWGEQIRPGNRCARTPVGQYMLDKIEALQAWSRDTPGATVPFENKTVSSFVTEGAHEVVKLPRICLSVRADQDIAAVLPVRFDNRPLSVREYLDLLREFPTAEQLGDGRPIGRAQSRSD